MSSKQKIEEHIWSVAQTAVDFINCLTEEQAEMLKIPEEIDDLIHMEIVSNEEGVDIFVEKDRIYAWASYKDGMIECGSPEDNMKDFVDKLFTKITTEKWVEGEEND